MEPLGIFAGAAVAAGCFFAGRRLRDEEGRKLSAVVAALVRQSQERQDSIFRINKELEGVMLAARQAQELAAEVRNELPPGGLGALEGISEQSEVNRVGLLALRRELQPKLDGLAGMAQEQERERQTLERIEGEQQRLIAALEAALQSMVANSQELMTSVRQTEVDSQDMRRDFVQLDALVQQVINALQEQERRLEQAGEVINANGNLLRETIERLGAPELRVPQNPPPSLAEDATGGAPPLPRPTEAPATPNPIAMDPGEVLRQLRQQYGMNAPAEPMGDAFRGMGSQSL